MLKKIAAVMLSVCISTTVTAGVQAAEINSEEPAAEELFADDSQEIQTESISAIAGDMAAYAEEMGQDYQELKTQINIAAERKASEELGKKMEELALESARRVEKKRVAERKELVEFALQFEGNPYVYGGTSLTNGADCSGFVMSVFKNFGYELPRVAAAQFEASRKKEISEIEPGDLVFYGGGISHVALYIGDGKIIHASTSASGIKISDYDYETPVGIGTYLK